ncbi:MAG: hypothetical protein HC836_01580 [Richelia sp. RM2_1_2]|nr:hypothetical protein [Richelia sp. SL_2_1]NJO57108.1 hypothetical protein [Richelia sp. RM2_1_2]
MRLTAINSNTRIKIKGYLEGFIQGIIDEYKGREILKPDNAVYNIYPDFHLIEN